MLRGGQETDADILATHLAERHRLGQQRGRRRDVGAVSVDGSAFSALHGIQSTMVNTGHNVSMSSVINVIVDLAPMP